MSKHATYNWQNGLLLATSIDCNAIKVSASSCEWNYSSSGKSTMFDSAVMLQATIYRFSAIHSFSQLKYFVKSLFVLTWDKNFSDAMFSILVSSSILYWICIPEVRSSRILDFKIVHHICQIIHALQ